MASYVRNILTKNYYNQVIFVQVTIENVWDVFLRHSVVIFLEYARIARLAVDIDIHEYVHGYIRGYCHCHNITYLIAIFCYITYLQGAPTAPICGFIPH